MAGMFGYSREAVRVKVKKCEGFLPPEWRKFSVDPQITSLEVLYSILAKAFDLKSDFAISYRTLDPNGQDIYVAVLSDWDLDAAFLRAHNLSISSSSEPCLNLKVDIKPFSEAPDWDATSQTSGGGGVPRDASQLSQSIGVGQKYVQSMQNRLPGLIMNQMEKTFSMVTRALNFTDDQQLLPAPRPPLSDTEFRGFLDSVGQIIHPHQLRRVIYAGGIDPSLRRVVWKHILNVYPDGMTGRERMDYMKRKAGEYQRLRDTWRAALQRGSVEGELAYVTSMVRKDVLRTDRLHPFYAGSDDNQNIASLFNILTTYALNHPAVSYCQGMSDIASPLLVTMGDEAQAYICFCAVMRRLSANFMMDGIAMTLKFSHLAEALQHYDPEFYDYLKMQQADDLLFCYRWLLLEMKREFAFEDSLRMLEVLWSALPAEPPMMELCLAEKEFVAPPIKAVPPKSPNPVLMRQPRENAYTKLCALRRQSSALSLVSSSLPTGGCSLTTDGMSSKSLDATKRLNQSLDENVTRRNRIGRLRNEVQSLDESKLLHDILDSSGQSLDLNTEFSLQSDNDVFQNHNSDNNSDKPMQNISDAQVNGNLSTSPPKNTQHAQSNKTIPKKSHPTKHSDDVKQPSSTHKSNNTLNNVMSKQLHSRKSGGHFKDLKERIAAGKRGIFSAIDSNNSQADDRQSKNNSSSDRSPASSSITTQKVVKNFNEFLNFASINKLTRDMTPPKYSTTTTITTTTTDTETSRPSIKLTNSTSASVLGQQVAINQSEVEKEKTNNGFGNDDVHPLPLSVQRIGEFEERRPSGDGSSPDDSQEYFPMTTSMTRELRLELENLDRHVFGNNNDFQPQRSSDKDEIEMQNSEIGYTKLTTIGSVSVDVLDDDRQQMEEISRCPSEKDVSNVLKRPARLHNGEPNRNSMHRVSTSSANTDIFIWENPLHTFSPNSTTPELNNRSEEIRNSDQHSPDEQQELDYDDTESFIETIHMGIKSITPIHLVRKNNGTKRRQRGLTPSFSSSASSARNSTVYPINNDLSDSDQNESSDDDSSSRGVHHQAKHVEAKVIFTGIPSPSKDIPTSPLMQTLSCPPDGVICSSVEEASEVASSSTSDTSATLTRVVGSLPPPHEFGGGNPFLMFLCLTLLMQHRNYVLKSGMDYNEMAMHFDKMVRKHNVNRVLNQARRMYGDYLRTQKMISAIGASGGAASAGQVSGNNNMDDQLKTTSSVNMKQTDIRT